MIDKPYCDWKSPVDYEFNEVKRKVHKYITDNYNHKEVLVLKTELFYDIVEEPPMLTILNNKEDDEPDWMKNLMQIREKKILTKFYIEYIMGTAYDR